MEGIYPQEPVETFQVDDGSKISGLLHSQKVLGIIPRAGLQMKHCTTSMASFLRREAMTSQKAVAFPVTMAVVSPKEWETRVESQP